MRTTITLEPDVAAKLKEFAHRQRLSFKAAVDTVLRRGLAAQATSTGAPAPFVVQPHAGGFRPGIDVARLNQLLDDLDTQDFAREAAREP
mgnify:FL=1